MHFKKLPSKSFQIDFEITSRQKVKKISLKNTRIVLGAILKLIDLPHARISVLFCDDKFIVKLNKKVFKKSESTDVISFPLKDFSSPDYLGEVVVSVEQADKMCESYAKKWQEELALYLIHGILHLIGYDDAVKKEKLVMDRKQEKILHSLIKNNANAVYALGR